MALEYGKSEIFKAGILWLLYLHLISTAQAIFTSQCFWSKDLWNTRLFFRQLQNKKISHLLVSAELPCSSRKAGKGGKRNAKEGREHGGIGREVLVYSCYLFIYVYDPHCYWINLFSTGNLQDMLACFLHVFFFQKQISSKFQNLSFQVTHSRDLSKTSSWDAVCSEVILW